MIFRLFKMSGRASSRAPESTATPDGMRVYVIGDIHGRADLLDKLALQIEDDLKSAPPIVVAVFLGDYIDRGPQSKAVVDRLCRGAFPTPIVTLRGNHEQTLLDAFDDESVFASWRQFGGLETLMSYGVDVSRLMRGLGYDNARAQLLEKTPAAHRKFLEASSAAHELGDYFFCHAGVRPGVALARQADADLLWIRDEFLESPAFHGKIVVHGHTPVAAPDVRPNRINIDTGAYATGVLTCLVLEGRTRRIIST
jgi:serine/threonine protein phosphatase 1